MNENNFNRQVNLTIPNQWKDTLEETAHRESIKAKTKITMQELIRMAVKTVYKLK